MVHGIPFGRVATTMMVATTVQMLMAMVVLVTVKTHQDSH